MGGLTKSGIGFTQYTNASGGNQPLIPVGPANSVYWSNGVANQFTTAPIVNTIGLGADVGPLATAGLIRVPHATSALSPNIMMARNQANTNDIGLLRYGHQANRFTIASSGIALVFFDNANFAWGSVPPITMQWANNTNGTGAKLLATTTDFSIRGEGRNAGTGSGFPFNLQGGRFSGASVFRGPIRMQLTADDVTFETLFELANVVSSNLVTALNKGTPLVAADMPANTGSRVTFIANCATAPTTGVPVGGGILYVTGGALRYKGSAGTDSLVAAA